MHSLWQYLYVAPFELSWWYTIDHFRDAPSLCFKARLGAKLLMKMIYYIYSHANKTPLHKNGFALTLVLRVRIFGTRKWPIFLTVLQPELYFGFFLWLILNDEFYSKRTYLVYIISVYIANMVVYGILFLYQVLLKKQYKIFTRVVI